MSLRPQATNANRLRFSESAIELFIAVTLAVLSFLYFYRSFLLTGLDGVFGDAGDTRILIAILEHWHLWLSGSGGPWRDPTYFYPARGTLGLTDAYFIYGVLYSGFRTVGLDFFHAFMCVALLLSVIGFFSFFPLARIVWRASTSTAIAGATLFAFSNMLAVKMNHVQVACAMLLPSLVLLVWFAASASRIKGALLASAAGLLSGLVLFTAFQTGWFAAIFALGLAVVYVALGGLERARAVAQQLSGRWHLIAGAFIGACVGLLPFLATYLPILRAGKKYPFETITEYAPRFTDVINTGEDNFFWGSLLKILGIAAAPARPLNEVEFGYTPLLFALMLFATAMCAIRVFRRSSLPREDLALALGLTLLGFWLIQLEYFGFRPWSLVWYSVPGAIGIRSTFRSQLAINLAACMLIVFTLDFFIRPLLGKVGPLIVIVLTVFLVGEQLNRKAPPRFWRSDQITWLASFSPPPASCQAFFLAPQPADNRPWWEHQSDAMILSAITRLPTLNGNSSHWPAGWNLNDLASPNYRDSLRIWIGKNNITENLCELSLDTRTWAANRL